MIYAIPSWERSHTPPNGKLGKLSTQKYLWEGMSVPIPQLAVYTTYIPLIYCLLGGCMLPTTFQGNQKQPLKNSVSYDFEMLPTSSSSSSSTSVEEFFFQHCPSCLLGFVGPRSFTVPKYMCTIYLVNKCQQDCMQNIMSIIFSEAIYPSLKLTAKTPFQEAVGYLPFQVFLIGPSIPSDSGAIYLTFREGSILYTTPPRSLTASGNP